VYHRDLKPQNCLVNRDCTVKVCDFNLSRLVDVEENSLDRCLSVQVVTRWYRPPEVVLALPYQASLDVWSVGCVFAELLLATFKQHKVLFPGRETWPLERNVSTVFEDDQLGLIFEILGTPSEEEIQRLPLRAQKQVRKYGKKSADTHNLMEGIGKVTAAGLDLLRDMLQFVPENRITMEKAAEHKFFSRVRRPSARQTVSFDSSSRMAEADMESKDKHQIRQRFKSVMEMFPPDDSGCLPQWWSCVPGC